MENFRSEYRAWIPEAEMLYDKSGMYYQDDQYLSSFLRRIYDQFVVSHPSHLEINIEERLMLYTGFKATDGTKIFVRDYIEISRDYKGGEKKWVYHIDDIRRIPEELFYGEVRVKVLGNSFANPKLLETYKLKI